MATQAGEKAQLARKSSGFHFNGKTEWAGTSHRVLPKVEDAMKDDEEAKVELEPKIETTTATDLGGICSQYGFGFCFGPTR